MLTVVTTVFPTSSEGSASCSAISLPDINVLSLSLINIFFILVDFALSQVTLFLLHHPITEVPVTSSTPIPNCLMTLNYAEASLMSILLTQKCLARE